MINEKYYDGFEVEVIFYYYDNKENQNNFIYKTIVYLINSIKCSTFTKICR
ncbi:hypothetical protein [Anaeromicropila herbilytica]|uniref:Uncharacterized protein n=1 Tax=Anaeromicropila herbilytica TaxID=2785025 RepID=A0A7R7ENU2_9FIRM|nr:hypothetical protein [Anaeromicropila herbilytica]BCN32274.1 hypothetical protein bsdtb5_35690 [Anaeromicropila herbilytica]